MSRKQENLKWYSPFVFLVGAILSFADPITDILTLVEFYRADHQTWFGVALAFVFLPCLVFPALYFGNRDQEFSDYSNTRKCTQTILCGFHPFSAALARLQGFLFSFQKLWRGDKIDAASEEETEDLLDHIDYAVLFEAILESSPQFILQLYAMSVQEEPVMFIQIISLPVSFLVLAWAFTTADEIIHEGLNIGAMEVKHKLFLYITYVFLLSSRLFAVCYFTVSYKWWVIVVLLFHTSAIVTADTVSFFLNDQRKSGEGFKSVVFFVLFCCVHWLRDDFSVQYNKHPESPDNKPILRRIQLLSNFLFVLENFVMILLFYFSQHSNNWYSLPVIVCVCLFSVFGSVMRVAHFRVLLKHGNDPVKTQLKTPTTNNNVNNSNMVHWISTV